MASDQCRLETVNPGRLGVKLVSGDGAILPSPLLPPDPQLNLGSGPLFLISGTASGTKHAAKHGDAFWHDLVLTSSRDGIL